MQQCFPPLRPFALFVPPQNDAPQFHLPPIFQCTPDLLMQLLVLSVLLHANVICFCAKIQLQMFQLYLCLELLFTQIVSSHYMPSLLHIPNMMNATTTLQLIAEYSTFFFSLLFSTPLLLLFISTIMLPPLAFVYAHSSDLPFPLLFVVVFQLHFLHSYYCEL